MLLINYVGNDTGSTTDKTNIELNADPTYSGIVTGANPVYTSATVPAVDTAPAANQAVVRVFSIVNDYGDAPDTYGTDATAGNSSNSVDAIGPSHVVPSVPVVYLGATAPDAETDGQPTVAADGDDNDAEGDDEDNPTFAALFTNSTSYSVNTIATNTSGAVANVLAWIDVDQSGTFDEDEGASVSVNDGVNDGAFTLSWNTLPSDIVAGDTYVRIRITTDLLARNGSGVDESAVGPASDGEVEDYPITIIDPGSAFTCTSDVYVSNREVNESGNKLNIIDFTSSPFDLNIISPVSGSQQYNAIGYGNDNYIYAMNYGPGATNEVLRFSSDGSFINLGAVAGLPTNGGSTNPRITYDGGGINPANGYYYVRDHVNNYRMHAIDITQTPPQYIGRTGSIAPRGADLTFLSDGFMYFIDTDNGQLHKIDPTLGVSGAATITTVGVVDPITFGAIYSDVNDNIYAIDNAGSGFYFINKEDGTRTKLSDGIPVSSNDGAFCAQAALFGFDYGDAPDTYSTDQLAANSSGGNDIDWRFSCFFRCSNSLSGSNST